MERRHNLTRLKCARFNIMSHVAENAEAMFFLIFVWNILYYAESVQF